MDRQPQSAQPPAPAQPQWQPPAVQPPPAAPLPQPPVAQPPTAQPQPQAQPQWQPPIAQPSQPADTQWQPPAAQPPAPAQPQWQPLAPPPLPQKRPVSVLAIVGIILAILMPPIGVVLSILALTQRSSYNKPSFAMSIAGVSVGSLGTIYLCIALITTAFSGASPNQPRSISSDPIIDESLLTADYIAELPPINLSPDETQVVQVAAWRAFTSDDMPSTLGMSIPDSWEMNKYLSLTMYSGDPFLDVTLPSGRLASVGAWTTLTYMPDYSGMNSFPFRKLTFDEVLKSIDGDDTYDSTTEVELYGVRSFIGLVDLPDNNTRIVRIIAVQDTGEPSDMAIVVDIVMPRNCTQADWEYAVGYSMTALESLLNQ